MNTTKSKNIYIANERSLSLNDSLWKIFVTENYIIKGVKTLWPLFMDSFCPSPGHRATVRREVTLTSKLLGVLCSHLAYSGRMILIRSPRDCLSEIWIMTILISKLGHCPQFLDDGQRKEEGVISCFEKYGRFYKWEILLLMEIYKYFCCYWKLNDCYIFGLSKRF